MIKINLLTVERAKAKKKIAFDISQQLTLGCSLILVVAALIVGWRFWELRTDSSRVDGEIALAQTETQRLHSIIQQVQQFEQRRAQLQQRVALIEQLRKEQTGPVHMLDQISRSLPPMLWLTELRQGSTASEVFIEGRVTTMTGLSDFVGNLERTGYFKKSVEIVSSTSDSISSPPGELISFNIKAQFQVPGAPAPPVKSKTAKPAKGRGR